MRATRNGMVVTAIVAVLAISEVAEPQSRRMTDVLAGVWDWEAAPKRCQENPHSISFTAGNTRMEVRHPKGAVVGNQPPQLVTVYRILGEAPQGCTGRVLRCPLPR